MEIDRQYLFLERATRVLVWVVVCSFLAVLGMLVAGCGTTRHTDDDRQAWRDPVFRNGNQLYDSKGRSAWISNSGTSTTQGGSVTRLPNGQTYYQDRSGRVHTLPSK